MWPNPQETADLITFTGEILNRKLHFLCNVSSFIIFHHVYWNLSSFSFIRRQVYHKFSNRRFLENLNVFIQIKRNLNEKWLHALPEIVKFLRTLTIKICGGVSFQYSYKWVDWNAGILIRNATRDVFLGLFQNFSNSSFSEHPLKNVRSNFLEALGFLVSVSLIKWHYYRVFLLWCSCFKTPSWNHLWQSLVEFWAVNYSLVL